MDNEKRNTDKQIWRETPGDYYSPSIHVTEGGGIGLQVSGNVIVLPVQKWMELAMQPKIEPCPKCGQTPDGMGGEYPCELCGQPTMHDPSYVNLSDISAIWEILHAKNTGEIGYSDLQNAIESIVKVHNDISTQQPSGPSPRNRAGKDV